MQTYSKMPEYLAARAAQNFRGIDPEGLIASVSNVTVDLETAVSQLRITDRNGQTYRITIEND